MDAEVNRLLYVAATRARHMLVVSRWTENKGTPAWGVLNAFLGSHGARVRASTASAPHRARRRLLAMQLEAQAARSTPRMVACAGVLVDHLGHRRSPPHRAHGPRP